MKPHTQQMIAYYDGGLSVAEIAARVDMARNAVRKSLQYHGRARPESDEPRIDLRSIPRVDRNPCPRCGVRGDVGCRHQAAAGTYTMGSL